MCVSHAERGGRDVGRWGGVVELRKGEYRWEYGGEWGGRQGTRSPGGVRWSSGGAVWSRSTIVEYGGAVWSQSTIVEYCGARGGQSGASQPSWPMVAQSGCSLPPSSNPSFLRHSCRQAYTSPRLSQSVSLYSSHTLHVILRPSLQHNCAAL